MGATVTTGKKVFATVSNEQVFYCLWEQTYEKNCYPHTPSWSCIHFGDKMSTLHRIFRAAAAAEGGSLQNRGNTLKPENYIAAWFREMANPAYFENYYVTVKMPSFWWHSTEEKEGLKAAFLKVFEDSGLKDEASAIAAGGYIHLPTNAEALLIERLLEKGKASAYEFFSTMPQVEDSGLFGINPSVDVAYNPKRKTPAPVAHPSYVKVEGVGFFAPKGDGSYQARGAAYEIVGDFIRELWRAECGFPGAYKLIPALREHLQASAEMPLQGTVRVDCSSKGLEGFGSYAASKLKKFKEENSQAIPVAGLDEVFEMAIPSTINELYTLAHFFPKECVSWFPVVS